MLLQAYRPVGTSGGRTMEYQVSLLYCYYYYYNCYTTIAVDEIRSIDKIICVDENKLYKYNITSGRYCYCLIDLIFYSILMCAV